MFNVNLHREPHGIQDTIEVEVLKLEDERFLKRNRIQVDIIDKIFEIVLVARLSDSREISVRKGNLSVKDAFSELVTLCKKLLDKPVMVH